MNVLGAWWQTMRGGSFLWSLLPTVGALGLQLVTFALTARGLGVEQFGRYTALVAIVGVAVELVGAGCADLFVRAVSINPAQHRPWLGTVMSWSGLSLPWVIVGGTLLATGPLLVDIPWGHVAMALAGEVLQSRSLATVELILVAHRQVAAAGWLRAGVFASRLVLAALVFGVAGVSDLHDWIEAVLVQSLLVSALLWWWIIRRHGAPTWHNHVGELGQGITFAMNQTARALQGNMDRMILSRYADASAVGAYGAATRFVQLGMFPIQVVTRMLYPRFFQEGAKGADRVAQFTWRTATPALLGVGVMAGVAVAMAGHLAPWVLGESFRSAVETTARLALALPFIALQYPPADALTATNRQWARTLISTSSAVGFGFVLVLGAHVGAANGVANAFVLGHALLALALWVAWRWVPVPPGRSG
jgi:O-antigen/teichoic acid export membrane protein